MSQPVPTSGTGSHRIAAIDWMRGFVMILMIFDHASMSFDRNHLDDDSALYANAMTMASAAAMEMEIAGMDRMATSYLASDHCNGRA